MLSDSVWGSKPMLFILREKPLDPSFQDINCQDASLAI